MPTAAPGTTVLWGAGIERRMGNESNQSGSLLVVIVELPNGPGDDDGKGDTCR